MSDSKVEDAPASPIEDKPAEDVASETPAAEESSEKPADAPADTPAEAPAAEESNDKPADAPADVPAAEESNDKPAEAPAAEESNEKPADAPAAEESNEKPADAPAAEESNEKPAAEETPVVNGEAEGEKKEETTAEKEGEVNGVVEEEKGPFSGTFVHVKSDKLDAFLQAAGVNWLKRQAACKFSPSQDICQKGDDFRVKMKTALFTKSASFKVGEEYTDKDLNSHSVKVVATMEDGKLVQTVEPAVEGKGKTHKITREIKDNELIMTMEMGDVVCQRHFKKKK